MTQTEYRRLKAFLTNLMVKSDGSFTKFARKYSIKSFRDFEKFFRNVKKLLKNDDEGLAFGMIKDAAKTYVGKVYRRMPGKTDEEKVFNAWSVTLDYIALALDNLKYLKKVLEQMDKEGINKNDLKESYVEEACTRKKKKKSLKENAELKRIVKALKMHVRV